MTPRPRRIALATPHPWSVPHPVNDHVAELANGFVRLRDAAEADGSGSDAAGSVGAAPQVVVIAPSLNPVARRATRRALRDLAGGADPGAVFAGEQLRASASLRRRGGPGGEFALLAEAVPLGTASVALRSSLRLLMQRAGIDVLHVHDPLESDLTRFLVRHWPGLTIATFHGVPEPRVLRAHMERILDQVDLPLVPDARMIEPLAVALGVTGDDIHVLPDVARTTRRDVRDADYSPGSDRPTRVIVLRGPDDDALAARVVRALAKDSAPVTVILLSRWRSSHRPIVPRRLRGNLHTLLASQRADADAAFAQADVAVALNPFTPARLVGEALAAGVPLVTVDDQGAGAVPDLVRDARATGLFALPRERAMHPGDGSAEHEPVAGDVPDERELAAQLADLAGSLLARRRLTRAPGPPASKRTCAIDLHMHTSHSWDCATDPEALLYVARKVGLTAIAVTDHNEVSGALACVELAGEYSLQVIVGEEVKTAQGEVIGLFLRERIEPGLPWDETIRRIRAQDGLVYVPHPFDRLHTIPDVQTLRASIDEIDAFEVYNARLTFEQYNRDAERFARKYNLIEGAGSDAHVVQGLGTAAVHMPAWDDPESFLTALRQGEIVRRPRSLLYLQGLKLLDTVTGRTKQPPDNSLR